MDLPSTWFTRPKPCSDSSRDMNRPAPQSTAYGSRLLMTAQAATIAVAVACLALPPAHGRMMLVPVDGRSSAATLAAAVAQGALPLEAGPVPGALVVMAPAPGMARSFLRAGLVPLASPPAGCGTAAA